ncbi:hypothetical protein QJS04_geneDACA012861 [Acorus gramineus]|uniref:Secreted protein n=1 Tax=Acorus gramineus TaxID=55184 RepID=A0AAV9BES0_ACOGR|nr:hypothetical protein QJS04_geneDACA012861 [Acorus gramineus]
MGSSAAEGSARSWPTMSTTAVCAASSATLASGARTALAGTRDERRGFGFLFFKEGCRFCLVYKHRYYFAWLLSCGGWGCC